MNGVLAAAGERRDMLGKKRLIPLAAAAATACGLAVPGANADTFTTAASLEVSARRRAARARCSYRASS
jgi:hypothetical protein